MKPALKRPSSVPVNLSVPFIHQLWDTPDNFDGHWACGPTSTAMVLAFYKLLSPHPMNVSSSWHPTRVSNFGWYLPSEFKQGPYTFSEVAQTPSGPAKGLYGTTLDNHPGAGWVTSPYRSTYASKNGRGIQRVMDVFGVGVRIKTPLAGKYFKESEFSSMVIQQLEAGDPVIVGGDVNGYGHIIVIRGYWKLGTETIFIVNDPFGRNTTGRREYSGGDVDYRFSQINPRWTCLPSK